MRIIPAIIITIIITIKGKGRYEIRAQDIRKKLKKSADVHEYKERGLDDLYKP